MVGKSTMRVGDRFGRLTVVELIAAPKNPKARCRCDCGGEAITQRGSLRNGRAQSCGCLKVEGLRARATTHGMSKTALYSRWTNIVNRCQNPKDEAYPNYGGRGITLEWPSFEAFLADMGEPPVGAWLERVDNDGPYSKANCVWTTPAANAANKRVSKVWIVNGETFQSAPEAARKLGVTASVIIRGCNGYSRDGRWHAPRAGWSSQHKYGGA